MGECLNYLAFLHIFRLSVNAQIFVIDAGMIVPGDTEEENPSLASYHAPKVCFYIDFHGFGVRHVSACTVLDR
jgi:hypothetical protein